MHVGALYVRLQLPEAASLKDKRQVVRSVLDKARSTWHLAASEVGSQDLLQIAELGFASVSGEPGHAQAPLERVLEGLRNHPVARLLDHELDVV